jgi:hypothetical protein
MSRLAGGGAQAPRSQVALTAGVTLYFFERIAEDDFIGPVVIAAPDERAAWEVLATREAKDVAALREEHWHVAQELAALPARPVVVYPSHYRRAIT